jgi:hypothetical protein
MKGVIALANAIPDMGALSKLDASDNDMFGQKHKAGITAWAGALKACTSTMELNLAKNGMDVEDMKILAAAISDMGALSKLIFGGDRYSKGQGWIYPKPATLEAGMTEAEFSNNNIEAGGAIIISAWLTHKDNGTLTKFDVSGNSLCAAGAKALAAALSSNQVLTELNLSRNWLGKEDPWGHSESDMSGVAILADAIKDMGALSKLDVRANSIDAKGKSALKKAAGVGVFQSRYVQRKLIV